MNAYSESVQWKACEHYSIALFSGSFTRYVVLFFSPALSVNSSIMSFSMFNRSFTVFGSLNIRLDYLLLADLFLGDGLPSSFSEPLVTNRFLPELLLIRLERLALDARLFLDTLDALERLEFLDEVDKQSELCSALIVY